MYLLNIYSNIFINYFQLLLYQTLAKNLLFCVLIWRVGMTYWECPYEVSFTYDHKNLSIMTVPEPPFFSGDFGNTIFFVLSLMSKRDKSAQFAFETRRVSSSFTDGNTNANPMNNNEAEKRNNIREKRFSRTLRSLIIFDSTCFMVINSLADWQTRGLSFTKEETRWPPDSYTKGYTINNEINKITVRNFWGKFNRQQVTKFTGLYNTFLKMISYYLQTSFRF